MSGSFFPLTSVFSTPTAAQWTSPDRNVTRMCFDFANCCSCSISQLRSRCGSTDVYENPSSRHYS